MNEDEDPYKDPHLQFGYDPRDEPGAPPVEHIPPLAAPPKASDNRGRRAAITANGEVIGSGAGAGGKGGPEDFDADPQAGGGTFMVKHDDKKPDTGADASQHNSA